MHPANSLQARRLQELIEILAGQRGDEQARAVTLGELRALQTRVNETVKTVTESGLGNLQGQVSDIKAEVALARAEALAANTAASTVQANLDTEIGGLQSQIDAIILDYNGPEGAVAAAEAAQAAAELARTQAQSAKTAAETAATDALSSKNAAATSATSAAGSATAAANAQTLAQSAAANVSGSAANAATSAATATNAANAAGQSALAAASSAASAASEATNAAQSASAATAATTAAETARSQAQTSATNAATAANNAATSASSAATSATTAAQSATSAQTQASAAATSATTAATKATEAAQSASASQTAATQAQTSAGNAASSEQVSTASAAQAQGHASSAATSSIVAAQSQVASETALGAAVDEGDIQRVFNAAAEVKNQANALLSARSVLASASNAAFAETKANEASQQATAAQSSATNAATSAASASTTSMTASMAATNAQSSAALALSSQQLAAQITSKSTNILADQFLVTEGTNNWTRFGGQGALTKIANELFSLGQTWSFVIAAGNQDGIQTESTDTQWKGQANADAYAVELDFTLVSGSLSGAGIVLDWIDTGSTVFRASAALSSILSGTLVAGQPMTATVVLRRPANFTGTFSFNRIYAAANWSLFGNAAKTIHFHRVSIRPASAEELGSGQVATAINAAVATEAGVRASEDGALAAQINTVSASVDGLSATVSSQAAALSTIDGKLAATYSFRAQAGTSGAQLELIASSDPSGTVSVARISADNILLNGSVSAPLIAGGAITADKIAANAITSGKLVTGQAVITQSAQIADAVITSAKIADAAIGSAKIIDATIGTAKIAAGAVTNNFAAFTAGMIQFGGTPTVVQTLTVECAGGPMTVTFNCQCINAASMPTELLLNGVSVRTVTLGSGYYSTTNITGGSLMIVTTLGWTFPMMGSLTAIINPGAGIHTVQIRMAAAGLTATNASTGGGSGTGASNRFLQVEEFKR